MTVCQGSCVDAGSIESAVRGLTVSPELFMLPPVCVNLTALNEAPCSGSAAYASAHAVTNLDIRSGRLKVWTYVQGVYREKSLHNERLKTTATDSLALARISITMLNCICKGSAFCVFMSRVEIFIYFLLVYKVSTLKCKVNTFYHSETSIIFCGWDYDSKSRSFIHDIGSN